MTRLKCKHHEAKRFGFYGHKRIQRYRCPGCNSTFSEPRRKALPRHYIETEKAAQIVTLLKSWLSLHIRSPPPATRISRTTHTVWELARPSAFGAPASLLAFLALFVAAG